MAEEQRESNKRVIIGDYALDIDVSSALTGLKAVKRAANEAVQAMEKLDEYSGKASFLQLGDMIRVGSLENFSPEELYNELLKYKSIETVTISANETAYINQPKLNFNTVINGPARVLIYKD
ncbi:hypothetical protein [Priestia megaterium]|uniref:hypothetical protein n=1 Tax=Priestia megaterium TaxID=1404 RepID=UPI002E1EBDE0|nr:hypothetical protein [Priestia megaterium]